MKAIVNTKYGPPAEVPGLKEIDKPSPDDNEVLVKVHATCVNYNTLLMVKGKPYVGRLFTGLRKPKINTPGNDIAGCIEVQGGNILQPEEP